MFWHATKEIARKEFLAHIRSTRLIVVAALFAISLVVTTIVLPLAFGANEVDSGDGRDRSTGEYIPSAENAAFAIFLTIPILGGLFFVQVLSVIMTSDGICSEWQNRSIFLLLSKPVPRGAFLLGKFVGSVVPLIVMVTLLMTIDYLVLQAIFPGDTIARDWGRFFGGVGILVLGITIFATMGLFFSTLTKSTLASLFMTLATVFLVLPLIGLSGEINYWVDEEKGVAGDRDSAEYDWSRYFNPGAIMGMATSVVAGEQLDVIFSFLIPTSPPAHTWLAIIAGLGFIGVFYAGALLVVTVRNFE